MRLDVVAVAATFSLLHQVTRLGEGRNDLIGGALGHIKGGADIAQTRFRMVGDEQER